MEEEPLQINSLCISVALAQYDIDLLALLCEKIDTDDLRQMIVKGTPEVCIHHGFPRDLSFAELVEAHNEKVFSEVEGNVEDKLEVFVKSRYLAQILLCLKKGASPSRGAVFASRAGNLQLFSLFLEKGAILTDLYEICNNAAEFGHLQLLQVAYEHGAPVNKWTTMIAAKANHFEILKWLHAQGTKCNDMICAYAALNGNFEMLKWAHENNLPWSVYTPCSAAAGGHLDILKWVVDNGCPWNDLTCANAAKTGNMEILRWAVDNGCHKGCIRCPCAEDDYALLNKGID